MASPRIISWGQPEHVVVIRDLYAVDPGLVCPVAGAWRPDSGPNSASMRCQFPPVRIAWEFVEGCGATTRGLAVRALQKQTDGILRRADETRTQ